MTMVFRPHPWYKELKILWLLKIPNPLKTLQFLQYFKYLMGLRTAGATTTHATYATIKLVAF